MVAPPARTELSDTYPNPSNAVMRTGMGKFWDYVTGLLGSTGNAADARTALGATTVGGAVFTAADAAAARTAIGAAQDVQATESVRGTSEVATQSETDTGTDDARIVTPKKLRWGFSFSIAGNGYIVFPSWLGGFIIQWIASSQTIAANTAIAGSAVNFPLAFPANCLRAVACSGTLQSTAGVSNATTTQLTPALHNLATGSSQTITFFAIAVGN